MNFTEHAKKRMVERNYTVSMIEDAMEPLMKQGKWDQRSERLTLNTNTDEFHDYLKSVNEICSKAKRDYLKIKKTLKGIKTATAIAKVKRFKNFYKQCKSKLANLRKLEHKSSVTLVLSGDFVLTIFRPDSRFKRDCART
jgi:hypothetical protein